MYRVLCRDQLSEAEVKSVWSVDHSSTEAIENGAAQAVELDLKAYRGNILVEMFGRNIFPRAGDLPYLLTLGPYQFYWFRLRRV